MCRLEVCAGSHHDEDGVASVIEWCVVQPDVHESRWTAIHERGVHWPGELIFLRIGPAELESMCAVLQAKKALCSHWVSRQAMVPGVVRIFLENLERCFTANCIEDDHSQIIQFALLAKPSVLLIVKLKDD